MSQRISILPGLGQFRDWRPKLQEYCNKCYVLANISVTNVSVTLWFGFNAFAMCLSLRD